MSIATQITLFAVAFILSYWNYFLIKHLIYHTFALYLKNQNIEGVKRTAKVISKKVLREGSMPMLEMEIELDNFSGEPVREKFKFRDTRPQMRRFEIDNEISAVLDPNRKPASPVLMKTASYAINWIGMTIRLLIIGALATASLWLLFSAYEIILTDLDKYNQIFDALGLHIMAFIYLGAILFHYLLFKGIGIMKTKKKTQQEWDLKYYGLTTMAQITGYNDTGTTINDNPMVNFRYQFDDQEGKTIKGSDRKVIGRLEIAKLDSMRTIEISYLPKDPTLSKIKSNIGSSGINSCIQLTIFFLAVLFSAIILGIFINNVFYKF